MYVIRVTVRYDYVSESGEPQCTITRTNSAIADLPSERMSTRLIQKYTAMLTAEIMFDISSSVFTGNITGYEVTDVSCSAVFGEEEKELIREHMMPRSRGDV